MSAKANFHTHTVFCDGKNTPEELVLSAISQGMRAIGFSGHAHTGFDESYCMSIEGTKAYKEEIARLKEKYADKLKIYCGLEMDYFSDADATGYDFLIGSVHYLEKNGTYYAIDGSKETFLEGVQKGWDGDFYAYAEDYFKLMADVVRKTNADIIGHFDLITKFNEGETFFSESHPRYCAAYRAAIEKLIPCGKLFEINTGAMARGYRTAPYPAASIVQEIARQGGKVILSSDCHEKSALTFGFDAAKKHAEKSGVSVLYTLSGSPLKPQIIKE